ncbi:hypothetical protein [Microvirga sp. TS319]|uniref:hypothetical protein n=1 Tax=Microvirga sp. TS319 TaxID=3241165 RepID=UPI00351AAFD0
MDEKQAPVALTEEELAQITGGGTVSGVSGATTISSIDLTSMDIETAMMMVQQQRVSLLDTQLKDQIAEVQARNTLVASLNNDLSSLNQFAALFPSDAKPDDKISASTLVHVGGKEMSLGDALTSLNHAGDAALKIGEMLQDGQISKAEIAESITNAKSLIDSASNSQQMDMLRLQSMSSKRNEAFDVMTNFVKKMQENRSSIIGNMR